MCRLTAVPPQKGKVFNQNCYDAIDWLISHVMARRSPKHGAQNSSITSQLKMAGDYPDVVVGCTGGGPNFAGIAFPFIGRNLRGETATRIVAVEPAACPTLTKGRYAYDFGDIEAIATPQLETFAGTATLTCKLIRTTSPVNYRITTTRRPTSKRRCATCHRSSRTAPPARAHAR
jgi:hypothetical protein